jgi:F-type H+-transporting ATPase subunit b
MKINWFTVIAQVINFLILVWLLRHFLYKPVLKAIDEREKKIASQLKDATDKEAKAKKEQDEFAKKNEAFDQKKKGLMEKAVAETNVERDKLLEIARNDAATLQSKLENALRATQEKLNHDIVQKTQQEVFAIARKTLADLSSVSLEEQSANIFIKRIKELKKDEKKQFSEAFKLGSKQMSGEQRPILIQSAFDLPEKQQTEIKKAVNEILRTETQFQFKTEPEIISGIELTSNGYKLAWSISEYLNSLQKSITEMIKE